MTPAARVRKMRLLAGDPSRTRQAKRRTIRRRLERQAKHQGGVYPEWAEAAEQIALEADHRADRARGWLAA